MLKISGIDGVGKDISDTFDDYYDYTYDIFNHYAAEIVKYFIRVQTEVPAEVKGQFWTNHTFKAAKSFFAHAYRENDIIGLIMDYETSLAPYVKYLEFYYGERFAALPSLIEQFYPMIEHDLRVLYGEI
jgi:hypothetical protein